MNKFHAVGQDKYIVHSIAAYIQAAIFAESGEKFSANGKVTLFSVFLSTWSLLCDERHRVDVVISFLALLRKGNTVVRVIFRGPGLLSVVPGLEGVRPVQFAPDGESSGFPGIVFFTLGDILSIFDF